MVIGVTQMAATITERNPIRTSTQTITIKHLSGTMATNRAVGIAQVTKGNFSRGCHTRIHEIGSGSDCDLRMLSHV